MNIMKLVIEVMIFTSVIGIIAFAVTSPDGNITGGALLLYGLITFLVIAGFIYYLMKELKIGRG